MANFEKEFLGLLVSKWQFFIKNYYSKLGEKNNWIAILEKENYVYGVIVAEKYYDNISYNEALDYMSSIYNKHIILNMVVATEERDYNISSDEVDNVLIYSLSSKSVVYSGDACKPLISMLNYMDVEKDLQKKRNNSKIMTYGLIFINIAVFIISGMLSKSLYDIDVYTLLLMGAKFNELINKGEVWRLVTSAFLHGGLMHLVFNMYALSAIGGEVEYSYGRLRYLVIYICSALGGSIFSYLFNSDSVSVGASGAIFGLFGAMLVFGFNNRRTIGKAYMVNILKVIGVNILIGVTITTIDNSAHLGGLIVGAIVAIIFSLTIGGNKNELKEG